MERPATKIKVSFCGGISDLEIDSELTYDDVIHKCLEHVKDKVCDPDSDASTNVAVYLPVFGLRQPNSSTSSENPIWLPYWHQFCNSQESQANEVTYEFRVRHRPLGFNKPYSVMGEYLFLQMVDDFMRDPSLPVGDSSKISEEVFLLLLCISLLLQKRDLPLKNSTVVDFSWDIPSVRLQNLMSFPRQLSVSDTVSKRLVGSKFYRLDKKYWAIVFLRQNLKDMKERRDTLRFFKEKFYDFMIKCLPWYGTEVYQIRPMDYSSPVSAMFMLNQDNNENGLYYGQNLECALSNIEEMRLVNPTNLQDKKWINRVCLRDGTFKDLPFESKAEVESFLSMAQVLVKLCVRWDCFLSYDKLTHKDKLDLQLKSFGPLYEETAKQHLKELTEKPTFKSCGFLIHHSRSEFNTYEVVTCVQTRASTSGTSVVSEIDDLQFELHHITIGTQGDMLLYKDGVGPVTGRLFWSQEELSYSLFSQFGLQAVPRDYTIKAEINDEFKRDTLDEEGSQPDMIPSNRYTPEGEEIPNIFLIQDLKDQKDIKDKNIKIRKKQVTYNKKLLMQVRVVSTDQDDFKAFQEGLVRLEKLRRIEPQRFLKLYTNVLGHKLTYVTELPQHADLLTYICSVPQSPYDKVQLMRQVVATLKTMHDCKNFHGNIRSRKFLVFEEPNSQSVRLKLEFPGVTSMLDTLPLTHELNVERLAWLSPERRQSLPTESGSSSTGLTMAERRQNLPDVITYESECYAVGTTLAEILYRTDEFPGVDFKDNKEILCPSQWFLEGASQTQDDQVDQGERDLLEAVWNSLIKPCWNKLPSSRPLPNKLMADFVEINKKASKIADNRKDEPKTIEYINLGASEIDPDLSVEQLREKLGPKFRDIFSSEDLKLGEKLGAGNFGTVFKGVMTRRPNLPAPRDSCVSVSPKKEYVAVKMMKGMTGSAEESFIKEIAIASKMKHENVLGLIEAGYFMYENCKRLVLVSEYMEAGSLRYHIEKCRDRGPDTIQRLKRICLDIVKGMVYLSGNEIVHRDLAPRNVLLKKIGGGLLGAKVSDFGLSRILDDNYKFYRCETEQDFPWTSWPPECLVESLSDRLFTTKGDVWSFGVLLWVLFHPNGLQLNRIIKRQLPTQAPSSVASLRDLYCREWRLPEDPLMPDGMYGIMERCWSQKPSDRPVFVNLACTFEALVG